MASSTRSSQHSVDCRVSHKRVLTVIKPYVVNAGRQERGGPGSSRYDAPGAQHREDGRCAGLGFHSMCQQAHGVVVLSSVQEALKGPHGVWACRHCCHWRGRKGRGATAAASVASACAAVQAMQAMLCALVGCLQVAGIPKATLVLRLPANDAVRVLRRRRCCTAASTSATARRTPR